MVENEESKAAQMTAKREKMSKDLVKLFAISAGDKGEISKNDWAATLQLPIHPVRHVRHLRLRRPQHLLVAGTCVRSLESSSAGWRARTVAPLPPRESGSLLTPCVEQPEAEETGLPSCGATERPRRACGRTERERSGVGSVTARVEEPVLVVKGRVTDQPGDGAWPERGKQHLQVAHPVAVVLAVKLFSAQARRLARARGGLKVR